MGWFDQQIRQRMQADDDTFSDAFATMARVVMGKRLSQALKDDSVRAKSAIDEILKYYHVKSRELPDGVRELGDQLEYLMRPSGIMRRTVKLEGDWYKKAVGAMLGTRCDDGSPIALIPRGFSGYSYFDSDAGRLVKITKKNAHVIDEEAICFYVPLPVKKIGIKDMLIYIARTMDASDLTRLALATLAATLVGLLTPRIHNIIYSYVIASTSQQLLIAIFTFLFCVGLSQTFLWVIRELVVGRIADKMTVAVEAAGMSRLLSLPANFFKDYSSGELANRVSYMKALCSILTDSVLTMGLTSVFSLAYIAQMINYGPGLVIPGMLVILVTVVFTGIATLAEIKVSKKAMEHSAKESGITFALISGIQKIKLAGAEKRAFARWAKAYSPVAKLTYDPPPLLKFSGVIATCISLMGSIVIYYFTIATRVTLADYYAFNAAYGMVTGAFASLIGVAASFARVKPMLDMLKPVLEAVPEIDKDKKIVTRLSGGVELCNVSFRYRSEMPLVIDDLSLRIAPGQYVAIVGQTGCGKSTLIRLLLGFETPQKGAIYYDGKDLATLDAKSLRRHIGVVMQNSKLFMGDIFSNIVISAPKLTLKEAWEAAELAGVADDIRNMPMGMHTMISQGEGGISGGQRQRLMIARAIAPKPKILMFDEATSALDNITQKTVSDSLDRLKCTRIVIAHRLSTIKQCDRVLLLDGGKIIEDGTYEELLAKKGHFAQLVARQRLDDAGTD